MDSPRLSFSAVFLCSHEKHVKCRRVQTFTSQLKWSLVTGKIVTIVNNNHCIWWQSAWHEEQKLLYQSAWAFENHTWRNNWTAARRQCAGNIGQDCDLLNPMLCPDSTLHSNCIQYVLYTEVYSILADSKQEINLPKCIILSGKDQIAN